MPQAERRLMIQVTCSCGKTLSARPDLAGRRVKCPKCAATLIVPSPATPAPPPPDESPFNFGEEASPATNQRGLYDARRLAKYWRTRNGDGSAAVSPQEVAHRIPG